MNIWGWSLVIVVTSLALMLAAAWYMTRPETVPVARLADPELLPGEAGYGPFPAEPALLLSEAMAAVEATGREVDAMIAAAGDLGMVQE